MTDQIDSRIELTEQEKVENDTLLNLFAHPGWKIYQMSAEETLFTLMQAYFSMNLKETVLSDNGKSVQRFKSMEQLVIEQSYLRGRIDQMKDLLYGYQEQPMSGDQIDSFRKKVWNTTKSFFRRLCWRSNSR